MENQTTNGTDTPQQIEAARHPVDAVVRRDDLDLGKRLCPPGWKFTQQTSGGWAWIPPYDFIPKDFAVHIKRD